MTSPPSTHISPYYYHLAGVWYFCYTCRISPWQPLLHLSPYEAFEDKLSFSPKFSTLMVTSESPCPWTRDSKDPWMSPWLFTPIESHMSLASPPKLILLSSLHFKVCSILNLETWTSPWMPPLLPVNLTWPTCSAWQWSKHCPHPHPLLILFHPPPWVLSFSFSALSFSPRVYSTRTEWWTRQAYWMKGPWMLPFLRAMSKAEWALQDSSLSIQCFLGHSTDLSHSLCPRLTHPCCLWSTIPTWWCVYIPHWTVSSVAWLSQPPEHPQHRVSSRMLRNGKDERIPKRKHARETSGSCNLPSIPHSNLGHPVVEIKEH